MRGLILFTVLIIVYSNMNGQNSVPNGSFEELRNLPVKPNPKNSFQYEPQSGYKPFQQNLNYWFAATNTTPDLRIKSAEDLKECKKRFDDCDEPRTGNYCVGIITYQKNKETETYREYIQIKLKSNLRQGVNTFVEFWVRKERQAKLVSNNLGCYFSEKKISAGEEEIILVKPSFNQSKIINEKSIAWVKVSGEFIPQKDYNFLTIGNFFANEQTEVKEYENYNGSTYIPPFACYLIDDVRVWQVGDKYEKTETAIEYEGKKVSANESIILENIEFEYNKWNLSNDSVKNLQSLLDFMNKNKQVKIQITGHTDNSGDTTYNQKLSERRARSVMEFLVEAGVSKERLNCKGYGDTHPFVENKNEFDRQKNRRVEFQILK